MNDSLKKKKKKTLFNGSCLMKPKGGTLPFREGHKFCFNGLLSPLLTNDLVNFVILRRFGGEYLQCFIGHAGNYRGSSHE